MKTILQPAIRLMESNVTAPIAEGETGYIFQRPAPTDLDGSLTNFTAVKDASKGWPAIADQRNETETSYHGENSEFSFLIVNNKEGDKQLFVDLGKYKKCF